MMRCVQCSRDYMGAERFCHQCGEPLRFESPPAVQAGAGARSAAPTGRSRGASRRRRTSQPSTSLLFAVLVLVGAAAGLALVWHQRWMPPALHSSARLSVEPAQQPADTIVTPPAGSEAPEPSEAESPAPASPRESERPAAPAIAPAPTPPPRKAAEPAPAPSPAARPALEPAPARAPAQPDPPTAVAARPARAATPPSEPPPSTRILSVRADPAAPSVPTGARVVPLVPVSPGVGARGQLLWEPIGGGVLVVSGLPQPPRGRIYQLWLGSIDLGNRISGGLLAVDAQGAGTLRVPPPRATWSPDIFGVTMERQGGAREPSDQLVLVGELPKRAASASPPAGAGAVPPVPAPAPDARSEGAPPAAETQSPAAPTTVAALPPPTFTRGPEGEFIRVVPVSVERTMTVAQSVLRSLGWDIDQVDEAAGVIRTEPRNVTFRDFVVYAGGTRHALDVVVRPVTSGQTSISVRREVFEERRILWQKERKILPTPETAVEESLLDAIERLL